MTTPKLLQIVVEVILAAEVMLTLTVGLSSPILFLIGGMLQRTINLYISSFAITRVRVTHNKEARKPNCADCKGPRVTSYKGCPECKNEAFRQHVVNKQKSYASAVGKNSHPTQIASDITIYS